MTHQSRSGTLLEVGREVFYTRTHMTVCQSKFEVVMASSDWSNVVRPLSANPTRMAVMQLQRQGGVRGRLVASQPELQSIGAAGQNFPPLASWLAIALPNGSAPATPDDWISRIKPRFAQLCVILLVGLDDDRAGWCGWSVERGVVQPLSRFCVIGANMLELDQISDATEDTEDALRWTRTIEAVGGRATHDRVRKATVNLIGCSRAGTLAATMFTALGVRRLTLLDGDKIEPHNLDGMFLATPEDIGSNKAVTLGRRLVDFRPELAATVLPRRFGVKLSEPTLEDADLVVTCVDQDGPRLRAARMARQQLIPHLDIGTGVRTGDDGQRVIAADVRLLLPGEGCVRCVGGLGDLEAAEYENWAPPGALPLRGSQPWHAAGRLGSLITVNSMAVATGIQSWLDLLAGDLPGSIWHRLRWQIGGSWEVESGIVGADEDCTVCSHGQKS